MLLVDLLGILMATVWDDISVGPLGAVMHIPLGDPLDVVVTLAHWVL